MKKMKLILFLMMASIMQPICAKNRPGLIKKTLRVLFYGVETAAGWHFLISFHNKHPRSFLPWEVAGKIWNDKCGAGSEAMAAVVLLWHGLNGLDNELHISQQF